MADKELKLEETLDLSAASGGKDEQAAARKREALLHQAHEAYDAAIEAAAAAYNEAAAEARAAFDAAAAKAHEAA